MLNTDPLTALIPEGFLRRHYGPPMDDIPDDRLREMLADMLPFDPYMQKQLDEYKAAQRDAPAVDWARLEDAHILRVRDFSSRVPTGIDDAFRESILETCLAPAFLQAKGIDETKREATFVFTDPSLDSYKEVIDAGAFDDSLEQYMKNPVVLPEHRHWLEGEHLAIVGHTTRIFKRGKSLLGNIQFGTWPVGELRWQAIVAGALRAVSVGFRPVTTERDKDGILHYTSAKLKEVSTVLVGANDNALLVNSYIAAQAAWQQSREPDDARASDLAAMVKELRADVDAINAALTESKSRRRGGDAAASPELADALKDIKQTLAESESLRTRRTASSDRKASSNAGRTGFGGASRNRHRARVR